MNLSWNCAKCDAENFPFINIDENDFFLMSNFSGNNPSLSDDVNFFPNHNITKFTVECDKIITDINNDEEDPNLPSLIDSNYYDINEFNFCKIDKFSSFGLLHINIASLNKHIDDLN